MKIKRVLSAFLAAALLGGLLTAPVSAAGVFTDIGDPAQAEAAEILRVLGVVDGTGSGRFDPHSVLTRAAFCKMAVEMMGDGDKVAAQANRTIFRDVPPTHWANGYINVAASPSGSGETASAGIVRGDGSGNFNPNTPITFAQAVTMLMRILGYSDADVGMGVTWYSGYLSTAASIELTDGVQVAPEGSLTRGQAALLFENLLYTDKKGTDTPFLTTLGGTITSEKLIVDVGATAPDGSTGAVKTGDGQVYRTDRAPFSDTVEGRQAKLVLDKDDHLVALRLSDKGTRRTVALSTAKYDSMTISGGESIKVDPDTTVWKDGKQSAWSASYQSLRAGAQLLLQYSAAGELEYVFLRELTSDESSTTVLKTDSYGNTNYKIYKNGVAATSADLRRYDVITTDKDAGVLYVSDLRLTGVYENASPGPDTPAYITVMGHRFPVLSSAYEDLRAFDLGDQITILLSYDGRVAGAVTTSAARSTTVGVVTKIEGGTATVEPLADLRDATGAKITLSGETSYSGTSATQMVGQLVTVSASARGRLSLSKVSGSGATGALDLKAGKVGRLTLADNVTFYERVGNGTAVAIEADQITRASVPASQIVYVHSNYAGKADIILLDDATGDGYEYGIAKVIPGGVYESDSSGSGSVEMRPGDKTSPDRITVRNADNPNGGAGYATTGTFRNGSAIGIAPALTTATDGSANLGASVELKSMKVSSTAFDTEAEVLSTTDTVFPISKFVQCYNRAANEWFTIPTGGDAMDAVDAARAFADTLTVYYDKDPDQGGKIRLIIAG